MKMADGGGSAGVQRPTPAPRRQVIVGVEQVRGRTGALAPMVEQATAGRRTAEVLVDGGFGARAIDAVADKTEVYAGARGMGEEGNRGKRSSGQAGQAGPSRRQRAVASWRQRMASDGAKGCTSGEATAECVNAQATVACSAAGGPEGSLRALLFAWRTT
ncbi:MAG: hypothetical protein IPG77_19250 [Betaproteobacteria bacterium]|nr:hypothetical protein [Betaproteobacteria bacterium]